MANETKHCRREGTQFPSEEFYWDEDKAQWIHNKIPIHYITGELVKPLRPNPLPNVEDG